MINQLSTSDSPTAVSPIPWVRRLANVGKALCLPTARPVAYATTTNVTEKPVLLALRASLPAGRADLLALAVEGELCRSTYTFLLETAVTHYQQGWRYLLLDLRQCTRIELSGLFALCNIARLYSHQPLLDPDTGWAALRAGGETINPTLGEHVKVVVPAATITTILTSSPLCQSIRVYPDLISALAAFPVETKSPKATAIITM